MKHEIREVDENGILKAEPFIADLQVDGKPVSRAALMVGIVICLGLALILTLALFASKSRTKENARKIDLAVKRKRKSLEQITGE